VKELKYDPRSKNTPRPKEGIPLHIRTPAISYIMPIHVM